jgi:hypothetical protein
MVRLPDEVKVTGWMSSRSRRIDRETWLTLREAAALIGRELLGRSWSDQILDRTDDDSVLQDVERDLYTAISSGEVTTLLSDGGDPHKMAPHEALRLSFRFDLTRDCIELRDRTDRWLCQLNAHELELFLRKYKRSRLAPQSPLERKSECFKWLCQEMRASQQGNKNYYRTESKRLFGVSNHGFDAAWSEAITQTNSGWNKPGRRKSPR